MPNYTRAGKKLSVFSPTEFRKGMIEGPFKKRKHKGLAALLYYTGVRITEALRSRKQQFSLTDEAVNFNVGKRLKHGIITPDLKILRKRAFVDEIVYCIEATEDGQIVWPYHRSTGWLIMQRAFATYPHHFRLSKVTSLLEQRFTIPQVRMWTGLSLMALNFYIGRAEIEEMAEA